MAPRRWFFIWAAAVLCACSGQKNGVVTYTPADRSFSCSVPGRWKALENSGGALVSFFGPPDGPGAYSASIAVYHEPISKGESPRDYFQGQSAAARDHSDLSRKNLAGRDAYFFSLFKEEPKARSPGTETIKEEVYLIAASALPETQKQDF